MSIRHRSDYVISCDTCDAECVQPYGYVPDSKGWGTLWIQRRVATDVQPGPPLVLCAGCLEMVKGLLGHTSYTRCTTT